MFLRSFRQARNRLLLQSKKWHEIAVKRVALELSNRLLAVAVSTCALISLSFLGYRKLVFRKHNVDELRKSAN